MMLFCASEMRERGREREQKRRSNELINHSVDILTPLSGEAKFQEEDPVSFNGITALNWL